jgi:hypothetical protein
MHRAAVLAASLACVGCTVACASCAGAGASASAKTKTDVSTTNTACAWIRMATIPYQSVRPDHACPSVAVLRDEGLLEHDFSSTDPWGTAYKIECGSDDNICSSAGPDREWGTSDDIRVPPAAMK